MDALAGACTWTIHPAWIEAAVAVAFVPNAVMLDVEPTREVSRT